MASKKPGKHPANKPSTSSMQSTQKTGQTLQLDDTLFQLKNALDEWSDLSKNKKDQPSEMAPTTNKNQNHGELLAKTRKLLKSLNQQLDDLSQ